MSVAPRDPGGASTRQLTAGRTAGGPRRLTLTLPSDLSAARAARRALQEFLSADERTTWLDLAELACTELVTNAVLHAHTDIVLTLGVDDGTLRVEVVDRSPDLPLQRTPRQQATTGRGLALVAATTSRHGVRPDGARGKTVWFELDRGVPEQPLDDPTATWDGSWDDGSWDDATWDDGTGADGTGADGTGADGTGADGTGADGTGAAAPGEPGPPAVPPGEAVTVVLDQLPPTLWLAASEHHDTMLRELVLYLADPDAGQEDGHGPGDRAGREAGRREPDPRGTPVDMRAADAARLMLSGAVAAAVRAAQDAGTARSVLPADHPAALPWVPGPLTLELLVPDELVPAFAALQDAMDLAERLARSGDLLARPGLPEIVAVRDWACEQVLAQHRGSPVAAWPGTDHERFLAATEQDGTGGTTTWDLASLVLTDEAVVVADDSNRIVALSAAMADLVGWSVPALTGRRIVALIPAPLREAHVAGFSRHLTTGRAQLLGATLTLPVLHADGHELLCSVRIEEAALVRGRRLYLAVFRPADG